MGCMAIHNIDVDIFKSSQKHLPVMGNKNKYHNISLCDYCRTDYRYIFEKGEEPNADINRWEGVTKRKLIITKQNQQNNK